MAPSLDNIYFVGLMGAGKTTVAKQLAKRLQRRFLDTDHEIEERTGVRVPVIFEIEGEEGFRNRETKILQEVASANELVVATGGGVVMRQENREIMAQTGFVIYLAAEPKLLYGRTRRDANRPLLKVANPLARLEELFELRDPLYRSIADLVIPTQNGSVANLVTRIEGELNHCEP